MVTGKGVDLRMLNESLIELLFYLVPIGSLVVLFYALYLFISVWRMEEGTPRMKEIAAVIRLGANAYLKRQYRGVSVFFILMFLVLIGLSIFELVPRMVPFGFLTGGIFSGLAGFIGMTTATMGNVRTTNAVQKSLNMGLRVAFNSGAVMGLVVIGLGLLDLSIWFFILKSMGKSIGEITSTMLNFGMGASSLALFARVGGGIFTKAADVGADLVGKLEAGIPEDDPRNPAVIADNVGDNVGDVAGMGADLYESYIGSIMAAAALSIAAFQSNGLELRGVLLPLIMAVIGVMASIIGTWFVRTSEQVEQSVLLKALRRGVFTSAGLIALFSFFAVYFILGLEHLGIFGSIIIGLLAGNLIGLATEYFTSSSYKPTKFVASQSSTGSATVVIGGLSAGMLSTVFPVIIVAVAIFGSYYLAGKGDFSLGLYGVAIASVGMLSTLGITLATDAYGPVADNAGGIAEMSGLANVVRQRTDALDSLGNTTAATGKGFAIGSAALTALALIAAFTQQVHVIDPSFEFDLSITNPPVLIGLFIGGMLPYLFSSITMQAVGRAAQMIVVEVRRQFREIAGLMEGTEKPDYAACVDICSRTAQKQMVAPALIAIAAPVVVGLLLGVNAVAGLLAGATVAGFVMAVMMANAGGSWDNAKKFIEAGNLGGKGSAAHKAAVVGDTVGDPFKDTSGPSLNILIKLMAIVSVVFTAFIMANSLM
jgi:K(+)-stimulated pyrophosphate-energized sodium pump